MFGRRSPSARRRIHQTLDPSQTPCGAKLDKDRHPMTSYAPRWAHSRADAKAQSLALEPLFSSFRSRITACEDLVSRLAPGTRCSAQKRGVGGFETPA